MREDRLEQGKKILAILVIVILAVLVGHIVSIVSFNEKVHTVRGAEESEQTWMNLDDRKDSTSTWLKRDYDLYGNTVDLSAQTFDGTLYNHSADPVSTWKMTLRIQGDCFINNAWCGTVEIHQHAGTSGEKVQTLDLRSYQLEDVTLDYLYDGDLLIPLSKGDYLVYYPSEKDDELNIRSDSELTIGMILYYLDSVDLSDYEIEYQYHREYTQGIGFYTILILAVVWIVLFLSLKASEISYKRAWKAMELRKSGISYMSDIYDRIFIIDLNEDEMIPLHKDTQKNLAKNTGAGKGLQNMVLAEVRETYQELMLEFTDLSTLPARLKKESIACEYISSTQGWCQARFFAMDRPEGEALNKVIFAVQIINDEKQQMEKNAERIENRALEKEAQSRLFGYISREMSTPVEHILSLADRIDQMDTRGAAAPCTREIRQEGIHLITFLHKLLDASRFSAGVMELEEESYSLRQLLQEVAEVIDDERKEKGLEYTQELSPVLPDQLYGDYNKLKKILLYLLSNSVRFTEKGGIRLSVFGKISDDRVHLLVSVKDTGIGIEPAELKKMQESGYQVWKGGQFSVNNPGFGLQLIHGLLGMMDSELQAISVPGEGSEFYFEIDQRTAKTD